MSEIKVLVVDTDVLFREGLTLILQREPDFTVVGDAGTTEQALAACGEWQPNVAVISLAKQSEAAELMQSIAALHPAVRVLAFVPEGGGGYACRMFEAGASGCGPRGCWSSADLVAAVRAVHRGAVYLDPGMLQDLLAIHSHDRKHPDRDRGQVRESEREVVTLIAEGRTTEEVAKKLDLPVGAVETHRTHVMERLALRNHAQLVRYAIRRGYLAE